MSEIVIVGLGSSLGNKKETLDLACEELRKVGKNFRVSSYLKSEPVLGVAKEEFLNAVCSFKTDLEPLELLDLLQDIENKNGRKRLIRWEDRTLDLDILYYGNLKINNERLIVPHPRINERDFVKKPLLELFPNFEF